ncbi:MAG TPA: hypothetical protein DDZ76_11185 [Xanthomonadales bacterium]|nr:hypothetical protein [Xanthomonadales bacterium]
MTSTLRFCTLAACVAGGLAVGTADAAVRLSDAFDGNWFNPSQNGRGLAVDYVPLTAVNERPRGVFFGAAFTYDNQGNPFWVSIQSDPLGEFAFEFDAAIFRVAAGTWPTPATPGVDRIGTARVTIDSCNAMTVVLDMDADSGFDDVTYDYIPTATGAASPDTLANQCVYQNAFAGCPSFATPVAGVDRACALSGNILGQEITLTNDTTWVIEGKLGIGGDNTQQSILNIEPGTLIVGTGDTFDHIAISRGSKIYAQGRKDAPIVFTSPFELPGADGEPSPRDIGGLAIAGNAPANCNPNCIAEWDPTLPFGGDIANDDSGVVRYMQVRYAGFVFASNRELNSFTLAGVGSGTVLENLQSFFGADDAIEFFGGTVNVKYFVDVCGGDDSFDWDFGYTGKLQFGLVAQRGCSGEDHGMELANSPTAFDALPRARGQVANLTLIGNPQASRTTDGVQLKEGSGGNFWNLAVTGFTRSCIALQDDATFAAAGTPANLSGITTMQGSVISCSNNFRTAGTAPAFTADAWFNAQSGNASAASLGLTAGFLPTAGSPLLNRPFNPTNDWFVPTDYAGAFAGDSANDNWTLGWTVGVNP